VVQLARAPELQQAAAWFHSIAISVLRRAFIIGASNVKSLPFQHRKSHFIPDGFNRGSDARGV